MEDTSRRGGGGCYCLYIRRRYHIFILYVSEEHQQGGTIRLSPSPGQAADHEYEEDFEEDKEAVEAGAEYVMYVI